MTTQLTALSKLSTAIGFPEHEVKETLKRMIIGAKNQNGATCTDAELMFFTSICAKYELDPFVREVHAFTTGNKLMFCVGVDGWFKIMTRHPLFDGIETEDIFDANGKLLAVKAKLYLKGISRPVTATEYLAECKQEKSPAWQKYPHRMLENKAIAQAIRRGMGISELVEEDEKERIIDSMPQQQQVQHYQQEQFIQSGAVIEDRGVGIDDVKKAFAAAKNHHDLQVIAGDLRKKLEANGSFAAMKTEIMQVYNQVKTRLDEQANIEEAQIVDHGMIDTATGEVLPDDDLVPFE
ncbi:MAG: recombinase RecT [Enterovibrio sp.]